MKDDFKNWLLPKIHALGLTVSEFALECGLSPATVYFYLSGKSVPTKKSSSKMCVRLTASYEELESIITRRYKGRTLGAKAKLTIKPEKCKVYQLIDKRHREGLFKRLEEYLHEQ